MEMMKQENSSTNNITEKGNADKSESVDLDNPIAQALFRKAHKNRPLLSLGKENNFSARWNISECPKSRNWPREEHNISERHISPPIDKRGFSSALDGLTKSKAKNLLLISVIHAVLCSKTRSISRFLKISWNKSAIAGIC